MRGQVFTIDDQKIFTFGEHHRREFISWWHQEIPTIAEFDEGMINLQNII
jgi:hypothetical protein